MGAAKSDAVSLKLLSMLGRTEGLEIVFPRKGCVDRLQMEGQSLVEPHLKQILFQLFN